VEVVQVEAVQVEVVQAEAVQAEGHAFPWARVFPAHRDFRSFPGVLRPAASPGLLRRGRVRRRL